MDCGEYGRGKKGMKTFLCEEGEETLRLRAYLDQVGLFLARAKI